MNALKRYSRKEMLDLFTEESKLNRWLEVELAVLKVRERHQLIPTGVFEKIRNLSSINTDRIKELEKSSRHDLLAFVQSVEEQIGDLSQYLHLGLTSYDIEDSALGLLFKQAGELLLDSLNKASGALRSKATQYKKQLAIGRTHGVHAEPLSLGVRILGWFSSLKRDRERLSYALKGVSFGKISGAVGNYAFITPALEKEILDELGLEIEPVSTQIVPRDRIAFLVTTAAVATANIERIALQIRLFQQTEVGEASEPFYKGQKGSSAMPHKRNPILCERLCGISRLIRSRVTPVLENVSLWYERDISHSSVERFVIPEIFILLDYMYLTLFEVVNNLEINTSLIEKNLKLLDGYIYSEELLVLLQKKGLRRGKAYQIVQGLVNTAMDEGIDLKDAIKHNPDLVSIISGQELDELGKPDIYLSNVEDIFARCQE